MRLSSKLSLLFFGLILYLSTFPNVIAPADEDPKRSSQDELVPSLSRHVLAELESFETRGFVRLVKRYQMMKSCRGLKLDKPFLADKESIVSAANDNKKTGSENESEKESKNKRTQKHGEKKEGKATGEKGAKKAKKKPSEKAKKRLERKTQKKQPETSSSPSPSPKSPVKPPSTFDEKLGVHDKTIKKYAHIEDGYWVVTDEVLGIVHNDLMVIINMTKSGDVIAFAASETIQPATTLIITHKLTFTSAPLEESKGTTPDTNQVLTCPTSGSLLNNKAPMLMFTNLSVIDCKAYGETAIITVTSGTTAIFKEDAFVNNTLRVFNVEPNATLDVDYCQFKNNTMHAINGEDTGDGTIVKCAGPDSNIKFKQCGFYNNSAEGSGGAIEATNFSTAVIINCSFRHNKALGHAGAIYAINTSCIEISSSFFEGNSGWKEGGAVFVAERSMATIKNSSFLKNRVHSQDDFEGSGGGVSIYMFSNTDISHSTFEGNEAVYAGGGANYRASSNGTISRCTFYNNSAYLFGGGFALEFEPVVRFEDSYFIANKAEEGAGLHVNLCSIATVTNCSFLSNIARSCGGAMALYEESDVSTKHSHFKGNKADFGGAVCMKDGNNLNATFTTFNVNRANRAGGAIFSEEDDAIYISNSAFDENVAVWGGAIRALMFYYITIDSCSILNNRAMSNGGGIIFYFGGRVGIYNSNITMNEAEYEGGGVSIHMNKKTEIVGSTFKLNHAQGWGGAIFIEDRTKIEISNSSFYGNEAENGGGVYMWYRCHATIEYCTFSENTADNNGGAIDATDHSFVFTTWTQVSNNQARNGGGFHLEHSALDFSDSEVIGSVVLESGRSIKTIESKILFDKKTLIEGNTTIDGDVRNVQIQPITVEAPSSAEAPSSGDEHVLVEEPILVT